MHDTIRKISWSKGFTLLEVLVALFVLTFGFLGTQMLVSRVINSNKGSQQIAEATTLAQDKIEKLRNTGYVNGTTTVVTTENNLKADGTTGGIYTRTTTVAYNSDPDWNSITVNVAWSWENKAHNVELKTIIADITQ